MIFKPLKQILFYDFDSNNILFKIDCVDGKAKWTELTKTLSLKFQVSDEIEDRKNLNELEKGLSKFNIELLAFESNEPTGRASFIEFTINKIELRSATMTALNEQLIWRYFIEGKAIKSEYL